MKLQPPSSSIDFVLICPGCKHPVGMEWYRDAAMAAIALEDHLRNCVLLEAMCIFLARQFALINRTVTQS